MYKKWILLSIYLFSSCSLALDNRHCFFLGSEPSLLIKFKNISSSLSKKYFKLNLNAESATFTNVRPMSGGAFIAFFQPKKNLSSWQTKPGCYSYNFIRNLSEELRKHNDVEHVEPNIIMSFTSLQNNMLPPISSKQWNLLSPPGGIDSTNAFNITLGNSHVITAVLDSGILPNASLAPNVLNGVTFNNNGSYKNGASPSCDSSCEGYDHGTHVAGIIAASGQLAYGESIYGVAPHTKILPINVETKSNNPIDCQASSRTPCLTFKMADLINAVNWLNGYKFPGLNKAPLVSVVNGSFGGLGNCGAIEQQAINQLIIKNISIAVAAGNGIIINGIRTPIDAKYFTPANCLSVMPVSATTSQGFGASYSNYGSIIPFAAPGGDFPPFGPSVYSTIENGYGYMQGTSQASPHVAGLGALLYSIDPTLTPTTLLNLLKTTTIPFRSGGPGDSCTPAKPCGTGIINAYKAVLATMNQAPKLVWNSQLRISVNNRTQATIQWNPAVWQPFRSTEIVYTVNINDNEVPTCKDITVTNCIITDVNPKITNRVFVSATDVREIYDPVKTTSLPFTTFAFKGPILNVAERNRLKTSQAFVYYSSLGNAQPDAFIVNGIIGATVAVDYAKSRFIIDNISNPKRINNVSITAKYGEFQGQSNAISIPSIL